MLPHDMLKSMEKLYTEKLLLRKTAYLFYENGYHRTTLRQIAKEVGIQAPSIYYYFKSKEDMGAYFVKAFFNGYYKVGEKLYSNGHGKFHENHYEFVYAHCLYYKLLLTDENLRNFVVDVFKTGLTRLMDYLPFFGQALGEKIYGKPLDISHSEIIIGYSLASRMDIVLAELYGSGQISIYDAVKYSYTFFIKMVYKNEIDDLDQMDAFIHESVDSFDITNFDIVEDFLLSFLNK